MPEIRFIGIEEVSLLPMKYTAMPIRVDEKAIFLRLCKGKSKMNTRLEVIIIKIKRTVYEINVVTAVAK